MPAPSRTCGEGWQNGEEEVGERWGDDLNHHGIGRRHDLKGLGGGGSNCYAQETRRTKACAQESRTTKTSALVIAGVFSEGNQSLTPHALSPDENSEKISRLKP
jgi:hypothetical protein